jgi:outer membrane protein assembly factor BamB
LLWRSAVQIAAAPGEPPEIPEQTGYAASTMATDGRRVYAIFANGELAAFSFEGRQVWAKNLGIPRNPHGHASSLGIWRGKIIVQMDQGEAEQNRSRLYAIDGATGQVVWQQNRAVPASWATPIVVEAAGKSQIVTLAVPWVISYNASTGSELWRAEGLNGEVCPSAVFGAGLVLAVSPYEKIMAIRPDGQGDVTKTHVAWSAEDNIPDIGSPVTDGQLVFALNTPGMLTAYDCKDGKKLWEQDLAMECHASPTVAGNRLYIFSTKGVLLVVENGRVFKELARSDLKERVDASPAFARNRIFVRGEKHLFCLANQPKLASTE